MAKFQLEHEKLGVSELTYLATYTSGFRAGDNYGTKVGNPHPKGSTLARIWLRGKRAARKI